jgi:hypothetical protein
MYSTSVPNWFVHVVIANGDGTENETVYPFYYRTAAERTVTRVEEMDTVTVAFMVSAMDEAALNLWAADWSN